MIELLKKYKIQIAEVVSPIFLVIVIFWYWRYGLEPPLINYGLQLSSIVLMAIIIYLAAKLIRDSKKNTIKNSLLFLRLLWPFILMFLIYINFRASMYQNKIPEVDQKLLAIDQWLFNDVNIHFKLDNWRSDFLTRWFSLAYLSYFIYYLLVPLLLFIKKHTKAVYDCVLSTILASYVGFVLYNIFPATGPWYWWGTLASDQNVDKLTEVVSNLVVNHGNRIDAFPSLHVAVTTIFIFYLFKYHRRIFWLLSPLLISIYPATVYLRWHYVIDILAGFILSLIVLWLVPKINNQWFKLINWSKHYESST